MRWLYRLQRWHRDARAIVRGRVPERLWNRAVSRTLRRVARKLYR